MTSTMLPCSSIQHMLDRAPYYHEWTILEVTPGSVTFRDDRPGCAPKTA